MIDRAIAQMWPARAEVELVSVAAWPDSNEISVELSNLYNMTTLVFSVRVSRRDRVFCSFQVQLHSTDCRTRSTNRTVQTVHTYSTLGSLSEECEVSGR